MHHPNATTATGSGGLSLAIVWAAGHFGLADLGAEEGVLIAGLLTSATLLVGRKGLRGILKTVWAGNGK